jgi:hypothetical protein
MGLAKRVVSLMPSECWLQTPEIYETEKPDKTPFEQRLEELERDRHINSYLKRVDTMSGIGQFGLLLLGLSDGQTLDKPVAGINGKTGKPTKKTMPKMDLVYLRVFDETYVTIASKDADEKSPRYGYPLTYSIKFEETVNGTQYYRSRTVHWTRVLHVVDNRESSEILGIQRMKPVYNNLLDIRKILGGSGEMFWKGGFPGLSFEALPDTADVELDAESLKEQITAYYQGMQRYLAIQGVTTKSLAPQVADPIGHLMAQLQQIALTLEIPLRILLGSEEGKLASTQDKRSWAERVMGRRIDYVTPWIIRPFIEMLITYGVLPEPENFYVDWPDRAAVSDRDMADVARIRAEAMKNYMQGECWRLMTFYDFLLRELKYTAEEAEQIFHAAETSAEDENAKMIDEEERKMEMEIEKQKAIAKARPAPTVGGKNA